jgi:hypothetical protein
MITDNHPLSEVTGSAWNAEAIPKAIRQALEGIFPIRLNPAADACGSEACPGVAWIASACRGDAVVGNHRLVNDTTGDLQLTSAGKAPVVLGDDSLLDPCLRGRSLDHERLERVRPMRLQDGDRVLASYDGLPVWVAREGVDGSVTESFSMPLPTPGAGEAVFDFFNGDHFLQLLPLVNFVKRLAVRSGWELPGPKACFMFDDPNLHWPAYGHISYPQIVRQAARLGYHATFATVPWDGWYTHEPTARLFRDHRREISLLIHGNNHGWAELAVPRDDRSHLQVAADAVRQIRRLEERSGVHVHRVLAAPHSACCEPMMRAMLSVGVEGAFISPWSLRIWQKDRIWPPPFGLHPAEMLGGGFAVAPRFRFNLSYEGWVAIYGLLGLPLVPAGHHEDLKNGMERLEDIVRAVNRLRQVVWTDPATILRSNYAVYRRGAVLHIRPYSSRFRVDLPEEIEFVILELDPNYPLASAFALRWVTESAGPWSPCETGQAIPCRTGGRLEFQARRLGQVDIREVEPPPRSLIVPVRRLLCEARDRLAPAAVRVRQLLG